MEVGEEGDYIAIATPSTRMIPCIKTDSDESHFNVSLTVTFLKRMERRSGIEPKPFCLSA